MTAGWLECLRNRLNDVMASIVGVVVSFITFVRLKSSTVGQRVQDRTLALKPLQAA